MPSRNQFLVET